MDLLKILFIISVTVGISVPQEWLYTPPFPSEAETVNSFLTTKERSIDADRKSNNLNLTEGIFNGSLLLPPEEEEEEKEVIEENITTIIIDIPKFEELNDMTDDILQRNRKPFSKEFETNEVRDDEDFLESLGRAIGGGGVPGADFPIHYQVPETGFSCSEDSLVGYYADTDPKAACQVFHICQEDGRHDSFLCPVGTLFNQKYFVCDWWYNVDCNSSAQFYSLNEFLVRENWNRGVRPINLKNRTKSFQQIIEEIRNVDSESTLFANKPITGNSLVSNLGSIAEMNKKFEKGEEEFGMLKNDEREKVEVDETVEPEVTENIGEKEDNVREEKKERKSETEKKKEVKLVKEEKTNPEGKKEIKTTKEEEEKIDIEENAKEEKSETVTEMTEEERISNDTQRTDEDKTDVTIEMETMIAGDKKMTIENTKGSDKKEMDSKKETTTANEKIKNTLQDENQTLILEESKTTETSKSNKTNGIKKNGSSSTSSKTNGIKKNGSSSTSSNNMLPQKEIIGYTYSSKDGTEVEEILSKRSPSLNSYGVITDSLVNKKGIRN